MKKIIAVLFMIAAFQTAVYADAETDLHQAYIAKIQAQDIKYNTYNFLVLHHTVHSISHFLM